MCPGRCLRHPQRYVSESASEMSPAQPGCRRTTGMLTTSCSAPIRSKFVFNTHHWHVENELRPNRCATTRSSSVLAVKILLLPGVPRQL
eukprot:1899637-Rhodomonas_salina.2